MVKSGDGKALLDVPEQSIRDSFRLISIQPVESAPQADLEGRQLASAVYTVREPGERFTKQARLTIDYDLKADGRRRPEQLAIYGYNSDTDSWDHLPSTRSADRHAIHTDMTTLHAYYAVMASTLPGEGSVAAAEQGSADRLLKVSATANDNYLLKNTFEQEIGQWSNRDGDVGAEVALDDQATIDGSKALRITNTHLGGNFAVNAVTTPFDAREYPLVQFDYRIPNDVRTNLLVKVAGRWYEVGFTDDPKKLKDKRVNITPIGNIRGIIADDHWHTARFNLYDMLRSRTGNIQVEEIIFADWDVPGYMKLQFGTNRAGATYYIDNFSISRDVTMPPGFKQPTLLVDDFDAQKPVNRLGGRTSIFTDGKSGTIAADYTAGESSEKGAVLSLAYDVSSSGAFAGYQTYLPRLDLREFQSLSLMVKAGDDTQEVMLGVRDRSGTESKVNLTWFLEGDYIPTQWTRINVPLFAFSSAASHGK
ncbi:MAG: hypothetical protein M3H12_02795 [Chromatiales bacterium]|nr:hypothetical protein [Gammaproteobacteria bacterium]